MSTQPVIHLTIRVFGRVQGVSFRYAALVHARRLGVTGLARNESDGSVLIEAEANPVRAEKFVRWCKKGSWWSRVERVEVQEGSVVGFTRFLVQT